MRGLFVVGTDTGVGKTLVCQILMAGAPKGVRYWKPVQTGLADEPGDSAAVARVTTAAAVWDRGVRLQLPASPHHAAAVEHTRVVLDDLLALAKQAPEASAFVVEGAGGLLVPLCDRYLQADLIAALGLPVLLVASTRLGTINHTLLTLQALQARQMAVLGIVLSGPPDASAQTALRAHTGVPVLAEIPQLADTNREALRPWGQQLWTAPQLAALLPEPEPAPEPETERQARSSRREVAQEPRQRLSQPEPTAAPAAALWPPFTQTQTAPPPLQVASANGAFLTLRDGRQVLDGISSWWTSLHGHGHPKLVQAVQQQMHTLDHVLLAGCRHQPAEALAEALVARAPDGLAKVFFSDDGSTAVEVALKLAVQFAAQSGQPQRTRLAALQHGYHGDTLGALSVGDGDDWGYDFAPLRLPVLRLPAPSVQGLPTGQLLAPDNAAVDAALASCRSLFGQHGEQLAALVVEPLVQGAGGMRMHPPRFLQGLRQLCTQHGVLLIADEVMTGFGRTGALFACQLAGVAPDLLCVSKALTGGIMPLAATLATQRIFDAFLGDTAAVAFLHGHSFTGHPPACAAALASLALLEQEQTLQRIANMQEVHATALQQLAQHPQVASVRWLGQVGALQLRQGEGYFDIAAQPLLHRHALEHGLLLRPLGPVVYLLPPACTTPEQLQRAWQVVQAGLDLLPVQPT